MVSPRCSFVVISFMSWSYCRLLLSRFGHDRAKNDSGIKFPSQICELLALLYVCSGWSSDCVGVERKAWLPDKLGVFGTHTDRTRGLAFFSKTPE